MASSSSRRNPSTDPSSEWVSFSPYGDERTSRTTASDRDRNKARSRPIYSSSSDGWPMDEIMNDVEHQMDQPNEGVARQLEDIEVVLSTRPKPKKPSPRSRFSLTSSTKNSRYVSMQDNEEDEIFDNSNMVREERPSSRHDTVIRILQKRSELKRDQDNAGSYVPKSRATSTAIPQGLVPSKVPPRQIQNPRFKQSRARSPPPPPPPPPTSSYTTQSFVAHANDRKAFQSSLTWETSASSNRSNDGASDSEEADYSKSSGSRKIKCFLMFLAIGLLAAIGYLVGQWAQGKYSKDGQQSSPVQQRPESPVTVLPADADFKNPEPSTDLVINKPDSETHVVGYDYTVNTNFLVGVYYYPWHGERFHNGGGYMRKDLEPRHTPALGEYNDSDPGVIAHHMKWFRQANIGLLVTSWWGPNRVEDSNTKDVIMEHKDVGNLKIALHYETTGRLGDGREKLPNARTDIQYMCENYFDHPNYYKIDGRPVLFIYVSRKLDFLGTLEEAMLTMRSTASKCGHNLYLIGDSVFESAPDPNEPHVPFWYFDAVTNYDVYGSSGRPEGHAGFGPVNNYYQHQSEWKEQALRDDCRYIPAVSPGYNDRGVRMEKDHPPTSRRITSNSQEGSLFHYQLKQAKELVDWKVNNMILVNSFNEWHEDTQIEPVVGEPTSQPFNFTKGLEYEGYGELYLDILGAATSSDTNQHSKYDYLFL